MRLVGQRLLLLLVASAVGVLLLEGGARLVYRSYRHEPLDRAAAFDRLAGAGAEEGAVAGPGAVQDQRTIIHPYFGYVVNPDTPGINPYGFFRAAPITTRTPDRLVIAFFGGSVADQIFVLGQAAMIDALQAHPPFAGKRIEVLSTALGGYKQPQQLLVLAALLAQGAQFDIVINLDGFNEVDAATDNVQDGINPFYPHNWNLHARQLLDPAAMVHMGKVEMIRADRAARRRRFTAWPVAQSAFLLTVWDLLDRRQEAALRQEMAALEAGLTTENAGPQVTGPPRRFADEDEMFVELVELWARSSFAMSNLCRGQGIQYFHFLQPNQYLPGSKRLTPEEEQVAWNPDVAESGRVARGYPLLIERGRQLAEQGVDFTDLTMLFRDESRSVYDDPCCHFNAEGAAQVGRAIGEAIVARQ
ncbi:MAG: hypothetical protein ACRERC_21825 [Candidatus Binatia bacterium]